MGSKLAWLAILTHGDGMVAANIVIYTTRLCGFCHAAKRLLNDKGVEFSEIQVDQRMDLRGWLRERTGQRTVPQIFINGDPQGGYSELAAMDSAGELNAVVAESPKVDNPAIRS